MDVSLVEFFKPFKDVVRPRTPRRRGRRLRRVVRVTGNEEPKRGDANEPHHVPSAAMSVAPGFSTGAHVVSDRGVECWRCVLLPWLVCGAQLVAVAFG